MQSETPYLAEGVGTKTLELLEAAERYNRWLFSWLEPSLGELNCELGAGHGTLTRFALEGHRVLATEPSATGREQIRQRFAGHPRLVGIENDFFHVPARGDVDCIFSANVLEHIADDVQVLQHASGVLRSGGHFVAVVPAGSWLYADFDARVGHYRRYSRLDRTRLEGMLRERRIQLTITDFSHRNPVGALGWLVNMRWLKRASVPPTQLRTLERLVPLLRLLDPIPFPIGQSLVLRLTKP